MNANEPRAILSVAITPRWLYFGVAMIAGFLSKAGALSFAFSPDDYFFAFPSKPDPYTFIGMGRDLSMLLTMGIQAIGLTYGSIQFFTFWLSLAAFAWFVAISADLVAPQRVSKWLVAGCVAVIAAHPYLSTYYVFRMSMLVNAIAFATAAWALCILVHEDRTSTPRMLSSAVLVAIFCNLTQSVLLLYMTAGLAWALAATCRSHDVELQWQLRTFRPLAMVVIGSTVAGMLYFALSSVVQHVAAIPATQGYALRATGGLGGIANAQWKLVSHAFAGNESVFPTSIKIGCALLGVIALLRLDRRSVHWVIAALLLAVCGAIIATLPMTFSWHGYVPRTFFTLGTVLGLSYLLLIAAWRRPASRWFSAALFTLAGIFCLLSSTMFFEQRIMTQWDQDLARSIVADASAQGLLGTGRLRIVAHWPIHPQVRTMRGAGVNESAFYYPWSYKNLFLVASGASVNVEAGPDSACKDKPHWPEPGYLFRAPDGDVYACISSSN